MSELLKLLRKVLGPYNGATLVFEQTEDNPLLFEADPDTSKEFPEFAGKQLTPTAIREKTSVSDCAVFLDTFQGEDELLNVYPNCFEQ